ncbi:MAG: hypothetical protein KME15_08450 [Drouetiella hepatica Uher 2000/2452]|jgi:hypothetical protein|uniref:DUF4399 domain-containing protein n=1 Tax=Drouetiella hepatica Uher 2000/2452 TaxID=904376 RepID=A0A951QA54_9CYAN|nr:hypothetical protein [Drouetiella hepatica Uher 2000/2452]
MKTLFFLATATCTCFAVGLYSASHAFEPQSRLADEVYPFTIAHEGHDSAPHGEMPTGATQPEGAHSHDMIEVLSPLPTVKLIAHPDAKQGWNLEVQVTNFKFAPERVNQASVPTEGHAHLYVDGEKITRLYGNWYYLSSLSPGKHEITVALNANGHESLMHNGEPIQASVMVEAATPLR